MNSDRRKKKKYKTGKKVNSDRGKKGKRKQGGRR